MEGINVLKIDKQKAGEKFQELIEIVEKLRGPDGCHGIKSKPINHYFLTF